ncbi:F0F1 ATP synthase subunit A [Candidatus Gottesmanbacteria bacterium]|nr:F0F1 ATP synthase subunit A [Candidatus Gottesmanbacteria bacterium]
MLHISLTAEKIAEIGGFPITNSLFTTWLVMGVLITLVFLTRSRLALVPSRFQVVMEGLVGGLYNLFESVTGERTKLYFPLVGTLFIFIIFTNWIGLLPGFGTIGFKMVQGGKEIFTPIFRSGNADLNTTFALALISVLTIQFFGIKTLGLTYFKRFLNLKSPVYFFVGILDIVSEFSKIISFAFRLFGNIFAGEVLLAVIAFLMPVIAPIPFLGLEVFVGFIQALVFSMLTAAFLSAATASGH